MILKEGRRTMTRKLKKRRQKNMLKFNWRKRRKRSAALSVAKSVNDPRSLNGNHFS